jgi:phage-related protein
MRYLLPLIAVLLIGCGQNQSEFSRVGERTYKIIGPEIAGGAEGPNRRLAQQLCPNGYRKLNEESHKGGPDRADAQDYNITTIWTIKCI